MFALLGYPNEEFDGFTIDEAYHIAAGVSYVRHADFRINPAHPPLVKLWMASLLDATTLPLSRFTRTEGGRVQIDCGSRGNIRMPNLRVSCDGEL